MSREILFRGKRVDNGEWVYGDLCNATPARKMIMPVNQYNEEGEVTNLPFIAYEVIPETVGQCTGLYDSTKWEQLSLDEQLKFFNKHKSEDGKSIRYRVIDEVKHLWKGKELFEGDICKDREGTSTIEFDSEQAAFVASFERDSMDLLSYLDIWKPEIIGNIHQNPELLEASKDAE